MPTALLETLPKPTEQVVFARKLGADHDATGLIEGLSTGRLDLSSVLRAAQTAQQRHAAAFTQHFAQHFERLTPAAHTPKAAAGVLRGLPFSIKDLFDVAGHPTWAGSRLLHPSGPRPALPAAQTAPAVQRLLDAGGTLTGKTHMVEFAFAGVGLNPHTHLYPQPHNPWKGEPRVFAAAGQNRLENQVERRITGGSSSGAALAVACGASAFALGTDTGGSLRIPAALCGLVGFKPSAQSVPREGAVPLSASLDSVGAITRSVRDAALVHGILSGQGLASQLKKPLKHPSNLRLAIIEPLFCEGLSPEVSAAFHAAVCRLSEVGAHIQRLDLDLQPTVAALTEGGGIVAYEAYNFHHRHMGWLSEPGLVASYDPRVASRIARGAAISETRYHDLLSLRADFCATTRAALEAGGYDAVLSPTVPCTAPLASAFATDAEYFRLNALLLRNPSVVNVLDGCALSIPLPASLRRCPLPVGMMLWQSNGADAALLATALAVEQGLGHRV